MKIIHLITSLDKGGAESHLYSLVKKQVESNHQVSVIYFKGNSYWKPKLNDFGVTTYHLHTKSNVNILKLFVNFCKLFFLIKKIKPDIVHSHLALAEIAIIWLKNFFNFKFVVTKHLDSFHFEGSRGQNLFFSGLFLEKILFKKADYIIFISHSVKKYFLKKINVTKKKYSVIYYGICRNNNKVNKNVIKKIIKKHQINKNNFIILSIARAVKQKRLDILIKEFSLFEKKIKQSRLLLVSKGEELENLKKLAFNLNLQKKIIWVPYTTNVNEYFHIANVFCLSSDYEGLGLVFLESFKMRIPVIASNKSAIKEVVKNNYSGLLFDNLKPKALFECLLKVFYNKKIKKKLIENSTKVLKKKFDINLENEKTLKIYQRLL